jgi:hypothetical protein
MIEAIDKRIETWQTGHRCPSGSLGAGQTPGVRSNTAKAYRSFVVEHGVDRDYDEAGLLISPANYGSVAHPEACLEQRARI